MNLRECADALRGLPGVVSISVQPNGPRRAVVCKLRTGAKLYVRGARNRWDVDLDQWGSKFDFNERGIALLEGLTEAIVGAVEPLVTKKRPLRYVVNSYEWRWLMGLPADLVIPVSSLLIAIAVNEKLLCLHRVLEEAERA
jgi:hypothetical protein